MRTWLPRLRLAASFLAGATLALDRSGDAGVNRWLLGLGLGWLACAGGAALLSSWEATRRGRRYRGAARAQADGLAAGERALHGATFRPAAGGPCYVAAPSGEPVRLDVPDGVLTPGQSIWAFGRLERIVDQEAPEVPREGGYRDTGITEVWMLRGTPAPVVWTVSPERYFRRRARQYLVHALVYAATLAVGFGVVPAVAASGGSVAAVSVLVLATFWLPWILEREAAKRARVPIYP